MTVQSLSIVPNRMEHLILFRQYQLSPNCVCMWWHILSVCVCVCAFVCECLCVCMWWHILCVCVCLCAFVCECLCVCMWWHILCICVCVCAFVCECLCVSLCVYVVEYFGGEENIKSHQKSSTPPSISLSRGASEGALAIWFSSGFTSSHIHLLLFCIFCIFFGIFCIYIS